MVLKKNFCQIVDSVSRDISVENEGVETYLLEMRTISCFLNRMEHIGTGYFVLIAVGG